MAHNCHCQEEQIRFSPVTETRSTVRLIDVFKEISATHVSTSAQFYFSQHCFFQISGVLTDDLSSPQRVLMIRERALLIKVLSWFGDICFIRVTQDAFS